MSFHLRSAGLRAMAVTAICAGLLAAGQTTASAAPQDKAAILSSWTQPDVSSFNAWKEARGNQQAWSSYNFDWSTDYCSSSPDNPLGFPFETPCTRHDFGYRNYKVLGTFASNKDRIDKSFYEDLKRVCATYSQPLKGTCDSLAWTYYQAVKTFGSIAVSKAQIDRASELLPDDPELLSELQGPAERGADL